MDKIPVYEMTINAELDSDIEVGAVALVDRPAIEKNFLAFGNDKMQFSVDADRQIISGPAMVADTLIYRRDEFGEYNVFFSKNTIEQIAQKFFKKDYHRNLNLFHDSEAATTGVTIYESFVTDSSRGIQPMRGFEDAPEGTWFISAKVDDPAIWARIKSGEVKGFSVEGNFSIKRDQQHKTDIMSDLKTVFGKIAALFADPATPAAPPANPPATPTAPASGATTYQTTDGKTLAIDQMVAGGVVTIDGVPAPAGEYELVDGTELAVTDGGVISLVTLPENPAQEAMNSFKAEIKKLREELEALSAYKTGFTSNQDKIKALEDNNKKLTEKVNGLFQVIQELVDLPTADPIETRNEPKVTDKKQARQAKLAALAEHFRKAK